MVLKKILYYLFLILLGVVFIFSAISKFIAIDDFELYIFGHKYLNWNLSTFVARIIIGVEAAAGILLLSHIKLKRTLYIILFILSLFSIYLLFLILIGDKENCNCFGSIIRLTPRESLIKNIVLIAIAVYLLIAFPFKKILLKKGKELIYIIVVITSVVSFFILSPPDYFVSDKFHVSKNDGSLDFSIIPVDSVNVITSESYNVTHDKMVLCFFSPRCKFCRMAAEKLSIIKKKSRYDINLVFVFYGTHEDVDNFWNRAKIDPNTYYLINSATFFYLSGSSLPAIYMLDKGKVITKIGYRTINSDTINNFFKESD